MARVFDLTADRLLRTALHLVRSPATAEDVVQETFVLAIERASTFEKGRPVGPWLLGILTNRAKAHREREQRQAEPERLRARTSDEPSDELHQRELAAALDHPRPT